jgi:hypothetical protein
MLVRVGTITAKVKVNLAVQHMLAAARFSREVGNLEHQYEGQEFAAFWEGIFHNATACILTTVASLEAYANELFSDRNTLFPEYSPELMHNLWETYERKPVLGKFAFALLLLRKPTMDRGARPYQDIPMSNGRRTTWPTQKRFAKRSPEPTCGSCQPRRLSSRAA